MGIKRKPKEGNTENIKPAKVKTGRRKLKYGVLSTGIVVVFIAAVVIVNVIATLLLERYPITLDVTADQVYQTDEKTVDYIKGINIDVDITVLLTESELSTVLTNYLGAGNYVSYVQELFKKIQQYNSKINVRYIDYNKNPDFIAKFDKELTEYNIVVESEKRNKIISLTDFFNVELDKTTYYSTGEESYNVTSCKAEEALLSALMFVTDESPVKAVVIQGHNEADIKNLPSLLEKNNYEIKKLRLASSDLTSDDDIVIIAAPTVDYTDEEIKKLDKFLQNNSKFGKNLVYFASATQPKLPKLESYLKEEWGIDIKDGYLVETNSEYTYMQENNIFFQYGDDNYASAVTDKNSMLLLGTDAKPLEATFTEDGNRKTSVLFKTTQKGAIKPSGAGDKWKSKNAAKNEYAAGIVSVRTSVVNSVEVTSDVAVIGSLTMMEDLLSYASANQQYTIGMFDKLTQRDSGITIIPKTISYNAMGLSTQQVNFYGAIFAIIVPLICISVGVIVWARRRHR